MKRAFITYLKKGVPTHVVKFGYPCFCVWVEALSKDYALILERETSINNSSRNMFPLVILAKNAL